jgi:NTP pyrophosphatase (non-canonical NTP hydrolase)
VTGFTPDSIEDLRCLVAAFADERDWGRFHTPRNLLIALVSEVGEAADIVRWQGDADPSIPVDRRQDWAHELADCAILLIRLADRSGVDLPAAVREKLAIAGAKYPADAFRGSSRKYDRPADGQGLGSENPSR